jgi:hypothetical protein
LADAEGVQVLRTQGLESEAPLAFPALHRLLRPVLALVDGLPPPQARALRLAFGHEDGGAVEPFPIALATLSILAETAEDHPVVRVIDDAHWLDIASAEALLFAARRLDAEPVVLILSLRRGWQFAARGRLAVLHADFGHQPDQAGGSTR